MADRSLGQLYVDLLLRGDKAFQEKLGKSAKDIEKFGDSVRGLGDMMGGFLTTAIEGATLALGGLVTASTVIGATFEQEIRKVAVLAGTGLDELTESARRMGASTTFSATEAATAMESLAQAGFETTEIISGTEAALALAASSGGDLAQATALVSATMAQFGLKAEDSARISDVFTEALNSSALNLEGLATAMSYAGTIGASFGRTLEETTAAVAMFSNLGLEGSKAGTAFRMSMSQAANVSKEGKEVLKAYGLTIEDINPQLHNFGEILKSVGKSGMTTTDALKIFGTEAGGNIAALAMQAVSAESDVRRSFDGILQSLQTSSGTAETTAKEMLVTVSGAFEEASGAFEELLLSIFYSYNVPLRNLLLQIGETIGTIARRFGQANGMISGSLESTMGAISKWLDQNQERLATTFLRVGEAMAKAVGWMIKLVPLLDDAAIIAGTLFLAAKVSGWAMAIEAAIPVIIAATGSLEAFGAALVTATGGISGLTAVIGILILGLVALAYNYDQTSDAAERMTATVAELETKTKQASVEATAAAGKLVEETRKRILAIGEEAAARGELTEGLKKEIDYFSQLTNAQAATAIASGQLIEVGGRLVQVTDLLSGIGKPENAAGFDALKTAARDTKLEIGELTARIGAMDRTLGQAAAAGESDIVFMERASKTADEWNLIIQGLRDHLAQLTTRNDALTAAVRKVEAAERLAAAATAAGIQGKKEDIEITRQRDKGAEESADKLKELSERALEFEGKLSEERAKAQEDDAALARLKSEERIHDAAKMYGELAALSSQDAATQQAIIGRFADAVASIYKTLEDDLTRIKREGDEDRAKLEKEKMEEAEKAAKEAVEANQARQEEIANKQKEMAKTAEYIPLDILNVNGKLGMTEKLLSNLFSVLLKLKNKIDENKDGILQWQEVWRFAIKQIKQGLEGIAHALESAFKGVLDKLLQITGLSMSLSDMVGKAQEIADAPLEEGETAPTAKEAGEQAGEEMIAEATAAVEFWVAAAPEILRAIGDGLPALGQTIVAAVPQLFGAIAAQLPTLLIGLIQVVFDTMIALVNMLPDLLPPLLAMLPDLIYALAAKIPELFQAIVDNLPTIVTAIIDALPEIFAAIVFAIPQIIVGIIKMIPVLVKELFRLLFAGIGQLAKALWDAIFHSRRVREEREAREAGGGEAYTGIDYVPRRMRVTVHEGERVVPAERNARAVHGGPAAPGTAPGGGGFGGGAGAAMSPVAIAVLVDGQTVDGALVRANERGTGVSVKRMIRKTAGVKVGFTPGKFNYFSGS